MALETTHGSGQNGAEIVLDTAPEKAPKPTPKRRPNRPRICVRNGAPRVMRNGAPRAMHNSAHAWCATDKRSTTAHGDMHLYSEARRYVRTYESMMTYETAIITTIGQLASC